MATRKEEEEIKIPFDISESINSRTYDIYINQQIIGAEYYTKLFDLIRKAGRFDIIRIYINSPGGNLHTGSQLISAMKESEAKIVTVLDGVAMSLAPLILFAGEEIEISDNSMIMFHDFSTMSQGKGGEMLSSAEALTSYYRKMLFDFASPFLSDDEIDRVCKGQDFYFDTDEIIERMEKLDEEREDVSITKKKTTKKITNKKTTKKK